MPPSFHAVQINTIRYTQKRNESTLFTQFYNATHINLHLLTMKIDKI